MTHSVIAFCSSCKKHTNHWIGRVFLECSVCYAKARRIHTFVPSRNEQ